MFRCFRNSSVADENLDMDRIIRTLTVENVELRAKVNELEGRVASDNISREASHPDRVQLYHMLQERDREIDELKRSLESMQKSNEKMSKSFFKMFSKANFEDRKSVV